MNQIQIEALRDLAIDHIPRAQADREQLSRFGGSKDDFYDKLAYTSLMVMGKPGTPAIEKAAARILFAIAMLMHSEQEKLLTRSDREGHLKALASDAKELSTLTGKQITWLDSIQTPPPPAEEEKEEAPQDQAHTESIAGRLLTTEEAAKILGYKPATLTKWAREQHGRIQPVPDMGREYRWSGDAIIGLMQSGQMPKPRRRK